MGLEGLVQNIGRYGKRFLIGTALASLISFGSYGGSCGKEKIVKNGDNGDPPRGSAPLAPNIRKIVPIGSEPKRGMYLMIYDNSDNEDGFKVERKKQGETFSHLANLNANTETYDDWEVKMSTPYTYRIQAYNQFGSSGWNEKTQTSAGPQPGTIFLNPIADAYVEEAFPRQNQGGNSYLIVKGYYPGDSVSEQNISYLKFPYDKIPSYAIDVDEATLRLISQNEPLLKGRAAFVSILSLAKDWNENTVIWDNRPFNRGFVLGLGKDVNNDGQPTYWDVTPDVRSWLERITLNHGMELQVRNSKNKAVLYSRERNQLKPELRVDYLW